jgi:hypothetical protein
MITTNNYKKIRNKIIKEKNNNNLVVNQYEIDLDDYNSDENDSKVPIDFKRTFTKFFDQSQLQKQEKEIVENMEKLNIQPEVYLPPLSQEQLLEVCTNYFEITK